MLEILIGIVLRENIGAVKDFGAATDLCCEILRSGCGARVCGARV